MFSPRRSATSAKVQTHTRSGFATPTVRPLTRSVTSWQLEKTRTVVVGRTRRTSRRPAMRTIGSAFQLAL